VEKPSFVMISLISSGATRAAGSAVFPIRGRFNSAADVVGLPDTTKKTALPPPRRIPGGSHSHWQAIAERGKNWTCYRLYDEPPELYDGIGDPHNLAEVTGHAEEHRRLEAVVFKWMVESSDFLSAPEVKLESPGDRWTMPEA